MEGTRRVYQLRLPIADDVAYNAKIPMPAVSVSKLELRSVLFVLVRVISWIIRQIARRTIHQVTRSNTNNRVSNTASGVNGVSCSRYGNNQNYDKTEYLSWNFWYSPRCLMSETDDRVILARNLLKEFKD